MGAWVQRVRMAVVPVWEREAIRKRRDRDWVGGEA